MRSIIRFVLSVAVTSTAACAHPVAPNSFVGPTPRAASVRVDNQYLEDVRVYLVRGDTPILLGTVGSFRSRTFSVGPALLPRLADVRLGVRAADGLVLASPAVMANPGERVTWRLGPRLKISSIAVR